MTNSAAVSVRERDLRRVCPLSAAEICVERVVSSALELGGIRGPARSVCDIGRGLGLCFTLCMRIR